MAFSNITIPAAQAQDADAAALEKLLAQTGDNYVKKADNVWSLDFTGQYLPKFKLGVTTNDGFTTVFVIIAKKAELRLTPEALIKLLQANYDYDSAKISLDQKETLIVRIESRNRITDLQELKDNVEQCALVSDRVYGMIKPYLVNK